MVTLQLFVSPDSKSSAKIPVSGTQDWTLMSSIFQPSGQGQEYKYTPNSKT